MRAHVTDMKAALLGMKKTTFILFYLCKRESQKKLLPHPSLNGLTYSLSKCSRDHCSTMTEAKVEVQKQAAQFRNKVDVKKQKKMLSSVGVGAAPSLL